MPLPVIDLYNTIFPKTIKARKAHHADPGIGLVLIADAQHNGQRINGDPVFKRNVIPASPELQERALPGVRGGGGVYAGLVRKTSAVEHDKEREGLADYV